MVSTNEVDVRISSVGEEITLEKAAKYIIIAKEFSVKAVCRGMETGNPVTASAG